jgi:hypothetical protein
MFSRLKQNVQMYPRTATVVGCVYFSAILGSVVIGLVMHLRFGVQLLTLAELVGLVAFADFLTYIWVTADRTRLAMFLELLDRFEDRECTSADCPVCNSDYDSNTDRDDLWGNDGQDVAEYAVLLAVILAIALGTIHLIGSNAANVISSVGSQIQ